MDTQREMRRGVEEQRHEDEELLHRPFNELSIEELQRADRLLSEKLRAKNAELMKVRKLYERRVVRMKALEDQVGAAIREKDYDEEKWLASKLKRFRDDTIAWFDEESAALEKLLAEYRSDFEIVHGLLAKKEKKLENIALR